MRDRIDQQLFYIERGSGGSHQDRNELPIEKAHQENAGENPVYEVNFIRIRQKDPSQHREESEARVPEGQQHAGENEPSLV